MIYKFTLPQTKSFLYVLDNSQKLESNTIPIFFENRAMGYVEIRVEENYTFIIVTINNGYSWDGCTPKFKTGTNIIGVWDGFTHSETLLPKAYNGSLVHDFLLQFKSQLPKGFSYSIIHAIMYIQFLKDEHTFSTLYYLAVLGYFKLKSLFKVDNTHV